MMNWIDALFCSLGRLFFRFRDSLVPLVGVAILLTTRREHFMFGHALDLPMDTLGLVLLMLGLAIRLRVAASVTIRRSGVSRRIAATQLVRSGLYAHTRNPLYVANVLLIIGLALIYDSRWVWAIAVPVLGLGIWSLVRAEEAFLGPRFGAAYDEYRATVPRFWPRLHGVSASLADCRLDWRRAVRREHGTVFAVVSTALVLIAAERIARDGLAVAASSVRTVASAWVCCALLYGIVRWLKKTRRLKTLSPPLADGSPAMPSPPRTVGRKAAVRVALAAGIVALMVLTLLALPIIRPGTTTNPGSGSHLPVRRAEQEGVGSSGAEGARARAEDPASRLPAAGAADPRTSRTEGNLTSAGALASLLLLGSEASRWQAR